MRWQLLVLLALPCRGLAVLRTLGDAGRSYARFSTAHPHAAAAATAGSIICAADLTCQTMIDKKSELDVRRTAALTIFGAWHYGVPAKALYLLYDRVIGTDPSFATALKKMILDVYVHTPFLLIPSFYLITCVVRGRTPQQALHQLRAEWAVASFGSALFWTPLCLCNFLFVPQHSRIVFVSVFSFVHKTWLSWLSNRPNSGCKQP